MGKTLKTVGMVLGAAAMIATGVGALAMPGLAGSVTLFGVSTGTLNLASAGLTAVGGLLDKPQSAGSGSPSDWTSNPDQPTPFAFGRVGVAGKIIHRDEFGKDNKLQGIVSIFSGAGPIKGFVSYKADDLAVSFESNGGTAIGKYRRQMWRSWRLGNQPDTALSLPTGLDEGAVMPAWDYRYKLSGKACDLLTVQQDSKFSVYPSGVPTPMVELDGVFGYDPRYDSTYPGGAGPCRLGVRSTYVWIDNPIIAGLNWALGMVENGQVVGGIGASIHGIDVPAFVEAANVADANEWKVTAWPDTSEDASQVLRQFLQAGGASYARHAGKISCVTRGAARPSIVTITARDTCGPLELDTGSSSFNRLNTITPEFMSAAHGWQHVPTDPVTYASLRAEDGGKKADRIRYRFAPSAKQAGQLAAYDILDAREPFSGTIPLKPHLRRLKRGDCFTLSEPGFLLDGVKFIVLGRTYDAQKGEVRLAFRSETDGKHDLALGKTATMPEYPGLTPADPTVVSPPNPDDWVITPRPPGPGGTLVPGFDLSGVVGNSTATAIEVQWWQVPVGTDPMDHPPEDADWQSAGTWPPTATNIPINVPGDRYYWIGLIHIRNLNRSELTPVGPWLAGKLIAGGLAPDAAQELIDEATKEVNDKVRDALDQFEKSADLDGLFDAQDDLAEAVLKLGRGVTELQRVTETNTRDGGKLVKSIVRVMGGELDNAQGAIVQEAALSLQRDQAEALLREALALQVDENRATAENSLSALVTDLAAEVTARTALGARVELAEGAISAEAMVRANEDGVFVQNFGLLGARRPDQSGWILNKETVDLTGEGSLASVLSGLRITDGENSSSIVTLQTASGNQASQLTTLSNTVGDQTLSISQLLVVTQGLGARYTLSLDGSGAATQFIADGQTRAIVFKAASLTITDDGSGLSYVPATGRLTLTKGGMRTVLGAGGSLILWAGSTAIPAGAELVDNGVLGISNDDAWFGGATANGPFTTGSPSGQIDLTKNVWTTVASVAARRLQNEGDLFAQLQFEVNVAGAPDDDNDYTVQFRIAVANLDGSGAVGVVGNFGGFPVNTWTAIDTYLRGHISTARGPKRLLLQINPTGSTITTASVRSARMDGQYAGATIF